MLKVAVVHALVRFCLQMQTTVLRWAATDPASKEMAERFETAPSGEAREKLVSEWRWSWRMGAGAAMVFLMMLEIVPLYLLLAARIRWLTTGAGPWPRLGGTVANVNPYIDYAEAARWTWKQLRQLESG